MSHTKFKVVQRSARKATRIAGSLTAAWKAAANRAYRRRVHQTDHTAEDPNYEPRGRAKISAWDVC
jgi:hypothetical protein